MSFSLTTLKVIGIFLVGITLLPNQAFLQNITPDITIALDGSGDFTSIQAAIDAVPNNNEERTILFIKRGKYDQEKIYIPANKKNILLVGESREETIISYHLYECLVGGFQNRCPADAAMQWSAQNIQTAATLTVAATGFIAENLTIQNTAGPVGQAQAITVLADRVIFRNCTLTGYQDTIYLKSDGNRTYFEKCLIIGRTDYIYGGGTTFFQACEIRSWGGGWITAPATSLNHAHGYVFNECTLTYALNSPRSGDDGRTVALGRPWKNYPKVAWLYCNISEKIDPLGWPTKWNMPYADTSPDLHLYEYQNTGKGADMSKRSTWVGLRALTEDEVANYTLPAVLGGADNWDPTAEISAVRTFNWLGGAMNANWLNPENWDLNLIPDTGEIAIVNDTALVEANGGHFSADLSLSNGAELLVTKASKVTFLTMAKATLSGINSAKLEGRIRTRDSITILTENQFELATNILGVHQIRKTGIGRIQLSKDNSDFTGFWRISAGELIANVPNSLGAARGIFIEKEGVLVVDTTSVFYPQTPLYLVTGGQIELNADIALSEFYIDDAIQPIGEYSQATHPDLIKGTGTIKIGRPTAFTFSGLEDGSWDNPKNFQPALLPQAGETVLTTREIETTAFAFPANIVFQPSASLRLRGEHTARGTLAFQNASTIRYATSGEGFSLDAPLQIDGELLLKLNSRAQPEHTMNLEGIITGNGAVSLLNDRTDTANDGMVKVSGNNKSFVGEWKLTLPSNNPDSKVILEASRPFALGTSQVTIGASNQLVLSHPLAAGEILRVDLIDEGRIKLDTTVTVKAALINGRPLQLGTYDSNTHPEYFIGSGNITIGQFSTSTQELAIEEHIEIRQNQIVLKDKNLLVRVYDLSGRLMPTIQTGNSLDIQQLPTNIYVIQLQRDGKIGGTIFYKF